MIVKLINLFPYEMDKQVNCEMNFEDVDSYLLIRGTENMGREILCTFSFLQHPSVSWQ